MTLPVVDPPDGDGGEDEEDRDGECDAPTVAGVLLAAGTSSRFGERNKLLSSVGADGEPVVRRAAATLVDARVEPVLAVVGHEAERVRDALSGLPVGFVENPDFREGQSTSVRAGVAALDTDVDAAVVALGDMPSVAPDAVDALVAAYRAGAGDALAAAHDGRRGNPVLFDARYFEELAGVEGDVGGRELLLREGVLVETGDPGVRRDVDVPEDLEPDAAADPALDPGSDAGANGEGNADPDGTPGAGSDPGPAPDGTE